MEGEIRRHGIGNFCPYQTPVAVAHLDALLMKKIVKNKKNMIKFEKNKKHDQFKVFLILILIFLFKLTFLPNTMFEKST